MQCFHVNTVKLHLYTKLNLNGVSSGADSSIGEIFKSPNKEYISEIRIDTAEQIKTAN